jgi:hypothetical protein
MRRIAAVVSLSLIGAAACTAHKPAASTPSVSSSASNVVPSNSPSGSPVRVSTGTWKLGALAPKDVRDSTSSQSVVWTGGTYILWGGEHCVFLASKTRCTPLGGASYGPSTDMWTSLPAAPLSAPREGNAAVWTGKEMIIWGGTDPAGSCGSDALVTTCERDGAAYNPATKEWRKIAPSPLAGRIGAASVWTGREMIIWGGLAARYGDIATGAAYNPSTDTWRMLPKSPLAARREAYAIWTGSQMIIFAGTVGQAGGAFVDGASYDPAKNEWELLPTPPLDKPGKPVQGAGPGRAFAAVVWTGTEMIQWGGNGPGNGNWSAFENGEAYNPVRRTWRLIPDAPLRDLGNGAPSDDLAIWTGSRMIAIQSTSTGVRDEHVSKGASYEPATNRWKTISPEPPKSCCGTFDSWNVRDSSTVFVLVDNRPLIYTPSD